MTKLYKLSFENLIGARKLYERAKKMPIGLLIDTSYLHLADTFYKLNYACFLYSLKYEREALQK
jgi:hypothetical protein